MAGDHMNLSANVQPRVPPGFRFHPTEQELLHYYLRKKAAREKIDLDVILEIDLNKLEPWDIEEKCKIGSTPQSDWYFFSHKDKKYPTGTRTNRATAAGFWKATGRDKVIYSNFGQIGMRKTLVFYRGRAPHGRKSDWIMHEYRLDDTTPDANASRSVGEFTHQEGWVVCRVFKKKNLLKARGSPTNSSVTIDTRIQQMLNNSSTDGALDQIFQYIGRTCENKNGASNNVHTHTNSNMHYLRPTDTTVTKGFHERIMQIPRLEIPPLPNTVSLLDEACNNEASYRPIDFQMLEDTEASPNEQVSGKTNNLYHTEARFNDWAALDRFVASHLNGQTETSKQLTCFDEPNMAFGSHPDHGLQFPSLRSPPSDDNSSDYNSEINLWSFTRTSTSSSALISHVSNASI